MIGVVAFAVATTAAADASRLTLKVEGMTETGCRRQPYAYEDLISVFAPEAAVLEHDLLAVDVVPEPEAAEGEAPLAFAERDGFELLDVVRPAAVVRVGREDSSGAVVALGEVRVARGERFGEAVKGGTDRKERRHAF